MRDPITSSNGCTVDAAAGLVARPRCNHSKATEEQ